LELTLPHNSVTNPFVCHYSNGAWQTPCTRTAYGADSVTHRTSALSDFAVSEGPNAITLESFATTALSDGAVNVQWVTAAEWDHAGFNLYRTESVLFDNAAGTLNRQLIPSTGLQGQGNRYTFEDVAVTSGTWYYWLEDVDIFGQHMLHGPVEQTVIDPTAISLTDSASFNQPVTVLIGLQIALLTMTFLLLRRRDAQGRRSSQRMRRAK
jgi:hypothetical protein